MLDSQIKNCFIAPDNQNREQVEIIFDNIIKQILNYLCNADNFPPYPPLKIFAASDFSIPEAGFSLSQIQNNLALLFQHSMNPSSSKYIGHMDSISNIYAILGEMIAAAINNNMLSLEMSPFLTQLEYALIREFCDLFGLPRTSGGVITSGGSLANLQALVVARNETLKLNNGNLTNLRQTPVILCSEIAHASVAKAAMLIGIGSENVIKITVNSNFQMDVLDLKQKVMEYFTTEYIPIAIVATAGTTVTGSIDNLSEIAEIAKGHNIWLHIDAIYGGALIFDSERRHLLNGIEFADSISFNPQKWLYVAKTSSMVLFRNFSSMVSNFRITAPYMKEQEDFINLGEITIQGSHNAEILKLWLSLLAIGKDGYHQLIEYGYVLTNICLTEIKHRDYLQLVMEPQTNICCFKIKLTNYDDDFINSKLHDYLLQNGFFVSLPRFQGQLCLRMVLLNPFSSKNVIKSCFSLIDKFYNQHHVKGN